jgi:hypothetical protein
MTMFDVNPLGLTMHLRELDRQAAPKLVAIEAAGRPASTGLAAAAAALIARLRKSDWPWRQPDTARPV